VGFGDGAASNFYDAVHVPAHAVSNGDVFESI